MGFKESQEYEIQLLNQLPLSSDPDYLSMVIFRLKLFILLCSHTLIVFSKLLVFIAVS